MADKYLDSPANSSLIACLKSFGRDQAGHASASPADVINPYFTLGTHPDLVERVWAVLGGNLPVDCRWVLCATPVLAHPASGVVFAFAMGSLPYALRLPAKELELAIAQGGVRVHRFYGGGVLDLTQINDHWVLGNWRNEEIEWCRAAFLQAGNVQSIVER